MVFFNEPSVFRLFVILLFLKSFLQFLNREEDGLSRETRAHIKLRYKDVAKYVIWPSCRYENVSTTQVIMLLSISNHFQPAPLAPKEPIPTDPRAQLYKPDIEDERTPYLPATINSVLRSDSEDSSDAEEIMRVTRL